MIVPSPGSPEDRKYSIPEGGFANKYEAVSFYYNHLGFAVHPLCGPNDQSVPLKARGKKPLLSDWQHRTVGDVTPDFLEKYFKRRTDLNIGVVVRPPYVFLDLDSKEDGGQSAMAFINLQPELGTVPYERTAGGGHLCFRCYDLPKFAQKNALVARVNGNVTAELFHDGQNIVVAPSVHSSGHVYTWKKTGEIPIISWADLQKLFHFPKTAKRAKKTRRTNKERAWYVTYKGDLASLDIVRLAQKLNICGQPIDIEKGRHTVKCPWHDQHSGAGDWKPSDSSCAVFEGRDGGFPGFNCFHVSHGQKTLQDFLAWAETQSAGVVDQCCAKTHGWEPGQKATDGRPRVSLPGPNRPASEFTKECGQIIAPLNIWFRKGEIVVHVQQIVFSETVTHLGFHQLRPVEVCTAIEQFVEIGNLVRNVSTSIFVPTSMSDRVANILINSPQFKQELPRITRVLAYRIPMISNGELVFPKAGFDERFGIYTDPKAPEMVAMDSRTASMWLLECLKDFCFDGDQSLKHIIARLLTPMCRAIMGWDARGPLWIFAANRERLGKDYLAGIASLLFDGFANEDAPIEAHDSNETRKRITSVMKAGRNRMHFANCKGYLSDSALEQAVTSKYWSDRELGSNTDLIFPNEVEFSISGNAGILSYSGDLAHRSRHILLYFAQENPNQRQFAQPNLHRWVLENRGQLLSALATFVRCWMEAGAPCGKTPFASFPEWAATVGGVMQTNDLGDPCLPEAMTNVGGDEEARDMKILFSLANGKWADKRVELKKIIELVTGDEPNQLFGWLDLSARQGQTAFGKMLRRYRGRILDDIVLRIHADTTRPKFSFERLQPGTDELVRPVDRLFRVTSPVADADIADIADVLHPKSVSNEIKNNENTPETDRASKSRVENVRDVHDVRSTTISQLVCNREELEKIAIIITKAGSLVALDVETYGPGRNALNPFRGEIRLLTLAIPDIVWLIDLKAIGYNLGPLAPVLSSSAIIGHNLKFDLLWLLRKCRLRLPNVFCTMTAARLLTAGTDQKNDLATVLDRYMDVRLAKDQGASDWGQSQLTPAQIEYAANDVSYLHQLQSVLQDELIEAELTVVGKMEMTLIPAVVDMEAAGIAVDRSKLQELLANAKVSAITAAEEVRALLNSPALNLNSPPQLMSALKNAGVEVADTKAETLALIQHPAAKRLLQHRKVEKNAQQLSTLVDAVETDGRIHGQFNPTGTDTGRFSSSKPNLQNISRGPTRSCFVAPPGFKLVVGDYSQIELRAAAAIANETKMLSALNQKTDLHLQTAELVLGREATKEDRQLAKAVNFGLLFGGSAKMLASYARDSYDVEMTIEQATGIRSNYFRGYPAIKDWHRSAWREEEGDAFQVRTRLGRRRLLPSKGNKWQRFTGLVNTPIQGACADGIKLAIIKLTSQLPPKAKIISCVHDELILEVAEASAENVKNLTVDVMVAEMQSIFPEVPVEVEAKICDHWGQK